MSLRALLAESRPDLSAKLDRILAIAEEVWSEQHHFTFTEHGLPHIRQVERNLASLIQPLQSSPGALTDEEIFILLGACYLHDIGMQLADEDDARENHAEYSYRLIRGETIGATKLQLDPPYINDENATEAISEVARGHWVSHALRVRQEDYIFESIRGRLRLLSLLLAMADLLDISPVRARYYRRFSRLYSLPPASELHQKLHLCTKGFRIHQPDIPGDLQFEITLRSIEEEGREIAEWLLHWLTTQWRQIRTPLYRLSEGKIRWCEHWAFAILERSSTSKLRLSVDARALLTAEREEQNRLNRDSLVELLQETLNERQGGLFLFCDEPEGDGTSWARWCTAQAQLGASHVSMIALRREDPIDCFSLAVQLAEGWQIPSEGLDVDEPFEGLLRAMQESETGYFVLIAHCDEAGARVLDGALEVLFASINPSTSAGEVLAIVFGDRRVQRILSSRSPELLRSGPLQGSDIRQHLVRELGFSSDDAEDLMEDIRLAKGMKMPGVAVSVVARKASRCYAIV